MNSTRREFLKTAAVFGATAATGRVAAQDAPLLRFGVLSDVHVSGGVAFSKEKLAKDCDVLRKALKWMDERGVDAVVMPGDLADLARVDELQAVADVWNEVFPGGRGADGRSVEHVLIYGNHESYPSAARGMKAIWKEGREKTWREVFGEDFADLRVKTVKGFDFLCASWGWETSPSGGAAKFAELAAQCASRAKGRPFFEVQHAHLKGTCHGPYAWGHDGGLSAGVLAKYPNAVALSGHSHWHLGDERAVWQGAFTSIGCGSLRYTGHNDEDYPPLGPENGNAPWPGGGDARYAPGAKKAVEADKIMEYRASLNLRLGCQGLLVEVRSAGLTVRRHEFVYDDDLGRDWEIPLPAKPGGPFDPAKRPAAFPLCEYAEGADAKMSVEPGRAKDRAGVVHDVVNVKMPVGKQTKGGELAALDVGYVKGGAFSHLQFVIPSDFNRPQKVKSNIMYVQIKSDRIPSGAKVAVRPLDCFGRPGRVLAATCLALALCVAAAFGAEAEPPKVQAPFTVAEEHAPIKTMGRDYWTLLESHPYTDPYYQTVESVWEKPWNNRALCALPVFRDCGLVSTTHRPPPDEKRAATWRTVEENYGRGNPHLAAVRANAKPDKPLVIVFSAKRKPQTMAGEVDLDHDDWRAFKAAHPNLVGTRTMCEWGNDLMGTIKRTPTLASPSRRAELEAVWARHSMTNRYDRLALCKWFTDRKLKIHYDDLDTFTAFRAAYYLDHVAAAWGAKALTAETTNTTDEHSEYRWDVSGMFVRGAARQFGVPWCWYEAVFYNGPREDGTWMNNSFCNNRRDRPEGGVSASSQRRLWYYAYLNGANAVESESWTYCCFTTNTPSGKAELTARGRNLAAFHDFTAAHPNRGTPYAPVAILVPFAQGYTCMGGRAWMKCEYTPGDYAIDAVFFSIAPGWPRARGIKVGNCEGNLHNSKFAMMYDVLVPDSPQPKEAFKKALFRYPAAIIAGDYPDPAAFEDVLADYERAGGRLLRVTPEMLPEFESAGLVGRIWRGVLKFPEVEAALEKLQKDLFPFEVSGDCQYGASRTADGWWLWAFNNKGVVKFADKFERIDHAFDVTVTARKVHGAGIAGVKELVSGMGVPVDGDSFSFPIPAGDFAVFAVRDAE